MELLKTRIVVNCFRLSGEWKTALGGMLEEMGTTLRLNVDESAALGKLPGLLDNLISAEQVRHIDTLIGDVGTRTEFVYDTDDEEGDMLDVSAFAFLRCEVENIDVNVCLEDEGFGVYLKADRLLDLSAGRVHVRTVYPDREETAAEVAGAAAASEERTEQENNDGHTR